jgi:phosphatidylinositol alpha-1,6-mannosyltransferase
VSHLLVTNDFPPKVGGIQSYLWELWRRLPAGEATVLTTPWAGAAEWDAAQPFDVTRARARVLLPTRRLAREVEAMARRAGVAHVVLDPVLPLGLIGPRLARAGLRYSVVVHGAEVTVPGRLPLARRLLSSVLRPAAGVIAAGNYPSGEVQRARPGAAVYVVPPGVDVERFRPLDAEERGRARRRFDLPAEGRVVLSVSRLVPRKGMDALIGAAGRLAGSRPDLVVAIAGSGRDEPRLRRLIASTGAPVRLLGRVDDESLPALYGCADVFAMLCRDRWRGLEQEGFGIVFLEAAACGVPQVAGRSGGAADAVEDGRTGYVVDHPADIEEVAAALASLLDDDERRMSFGSTARVRAVREFSYDVLAEQLAVALAALEQR